jgi:hypothetical protein
MRHSSFFLCGFLTAVLFTYSCSKDSEESLVVEAQACLNRVPHSNPSAALECLAKIEGLDTPEANQLKCSGIFILKGFTDPNRLTQIAKQLKDAGGHGSTATLGAIGLLAFAGPDSKAQAEKALKTCEKSGSKGMTLLASMSNLATIMNESGIGNIVSNCSNTINPQECADAVSDVLCDQDASNLDTEMGAVAVATYNNVCRFNPQGNPMCQVYAQATVNGTVTNPVQVGQNLRHYLTGVGGDSLCP